MLLYQGGTGAFAQYLILLSEPSVGQSFGFACELPLGPELAFLAMNHRELPAKRKADGGAEAPALRARFEKYVALSGFACPERTREAERR
jgi:hypothetical protein